MFAACLGAFHMHQEGAWGGHGCFSGIEPSNLEPEGTVPSGHTLIGCLSWLQQELYSNPLGLDEHLGQSSTPFDGPCVQEFWYHFETSGFRM